MSSARSLPASGRKLRFLTPITSRFVSKDPPKRLGLEEKLERRGAAARRRRIGLLILLSLLVVAISVVVGRLSTSYTPIPTVESTR